MSRAVLVASLLIAAAAGGALAQEMGVHRIEMKTATGGDAGVVSLTQAPTGVLVKLELKNLTPGWHGLHFHEKADCRPRDFESAGDHVHGGGKAVHGLMNPEANEPGDLPNVFVDARGMANAEMLSTFVNLRTAEDGRPALMDKDGSAIVVHEKADDHRSQPIGGAGDRIACGEIE